MSGIDAAAAGMAAQQAWMDALANDIANVNTPGYRRARMAFRDLAYGADGSGAGAAATPAGRSSVQGAFQPSDDPLSLAIEGPGFFQVRRADGGVALTRAGAFQVDGNGELVTAGGERLVPPIRLPKGASPADVSIAADGSVRVKGNPAGTITLVDVPAPDALQPVGGGLFAPTQASGQPARSRSGLVRQGVVEASDVDLADAMVDLMQAQRAFQLAGKAVQVQDQLREIANGIRR